MNSLLLLALSLCGQAVQQPRTYVQGLYAIHYQGVDFYVRGTKLPDGNVRWVPDQDNLRRLSAARRSAQSAKSNVQLTNVQPQEDTREPFALDRLRLVGDDEEIRADQVQRETRDRQIKSIVESGKSGRELLDSIHAVSKDQGQYNFQKTYPGSPAEKKYGSHVRAADPPGASVCPGCGEAYTTDPHKCGFKFDWDNSPEQWRAMFKVCPTCRSPVTFTNGCVQCTVCPFLMVIDQPSFNRSNMRNYKDMYIPKPHDWQVRESQNYQE